MSKTLLSSTLKDLGLGYLLFLLLDCPQRFPYSWNVRMTTLLMSTDINVSSPGQFIWTSASCCSNMALAA